MPPSISCARDRHNMPHPCKLTFDLLTLEVVSDSHVTWSTSVPILVFLRLSVLELGPTYATDRRQLSDRHQTSDAHHRLMLPLWVRGRNNAPFHCKSHINQMPPQIIHIMRSSLVDSLPPDFVTKCIEVVRRPETWKFITGLLHYCTFGLRAANDAQNIYIFIHHNGSGKMPELAEKITTYRIYQKMIMWYGSVYNQITSDIWRYNNPVYYHNNY